jgi:serine/threonine-protein kinase mTOR
VVDGECVCACLTHMSGFEVAAHREKFPERIPFRLTRMLVKAMEVSGIEGNFRYTCEAVMRVLRDNRDSVMALLEAFVYDPLINWRLLTPGGPSPVRGGPDTGVETAVGSVEGHATGGVMGEGDFQTTSIHGSEGAGAASVHVNRGDRERAMQAALGACVWGVWGVKSSCVSVCRGYVCMYPPWWCMCMTAVLMSGPEGAGAPQEALNQRAVAVIRRVTAKLAGRDFVGETLGVSAQVRRLIQQAMSHENLCQCYVGWCVIGRNRTWCLGAHVMWNRCPFW